MKKIIISLLAVIAITAAVYGFISWQEKLSDQPQRQESGLGQR